MDVLLEFKDIRPPKGAATTELEAQLVNHLTFYGKAAFDALPAEDKAEWQAITNENFRRFRKMDRNQSLNVAFEYLPYDGICFGEVLTKYHDRVKGRVGKLWVPDYFEVREHLEGRKEPKATKFQPLVPLPWSREIEV